jgi:hypothetical protein
MVTQDINVLVISGADRSNDCKLDKARNLKSSLNFDFFLHKPPKNLYLLGSGKLLPDG